MTKVKLSITIDEELIDWLENEIDSKRFGSKSHGIEVAVGFLKKAIEAGETIEYDF